MKKIKQCVLPLLTLILVLLGAAMPWLSAQLQDRRTNGREERFDLDTISLMFLQDSGVERTLRIAAEGYTTMTWDGKTSLKKSEAQEAARDVIQLMCAYSLIPITAPRRLDKTGEPAAEPCLIAAEDGRSALVWHCYWETGPDKIYSVMVDDVTGKAVRILAQEGQTFQEAEADALIRLEFWRAFLQDYYKFMLFDMEEWVEGTDADPVYRFGLRLASEEGVEL